MKIHSSSKCQYWLSAILIAFSSMSFGQVDLDRGLVAHYPLDGNGLNKAKSSRNGDLRNVVPAEDRFGNSNGAYRFNGSNSSIYVSNLFHDISDIENITMSAWFSPDRDYDGARDSFTILIGPSSDDGWGLGYSEMIGKEGYDRSPFQYYSYSEKKNKRKICGVSRNFKKNQWYHVTAVKNSSHMKMYIDGQLVSTIENGLPSYHPGALSIGAHVYNKGNGRWYFHGRIDEVRIYNRSLSNEEASSLYENEKPQAKVQKEENTIISAKPGLIAHYPLDGHASDKSGNGNHAMILGASPTTDRNGVQNGAYQFDGVDDVLKLGSFEIGQTGSISMWVNYLYNQKASIGNVAYGCIYGRQKDGGFSNFVLGLDNANPDFAKLKWQPYRYQGVNFKSSTNVGNNVWRHVVVTFDGSVHRLFMDGQEVGNANISGSFKTSDMSHTLGAWIDGGNSFFRGKIDDLKIFNKALTALEVSTLYTGVEPKPEIAIYSPDVSRGFKPVMEAKQVSVVGRATDQSGIYEVTVNGQEANVDAQGIFNKTILLGIGENKIVVEATNVNQAKASKEFTIVRNGSTQVATVANAVPAGVSSSSAKITVGKYYALIIGNDQYNDPGITSLNKPILDATQLYQTLTSKYTFDPSNVTFLKNATYVQMIEALDELSNKVTDDDNLLVFYAGHGWWDEKKKLGYWLPTDAKEKSTAFWIANSRISDYMGSIHSKHTLLIADACFSGSIFKTRAAFADAQPAINKLYDLPSRKAMTSGNLKEVPDESAFLRFLVKRLNDNSEKYISSDMLFSSFRLAVLNNSPTEPQYGTIQNAGDEGGEFIFIRR